MGSDTSDGRATSASVNSSAEDSLRAIGVEVGSIVAEKYRVEGILGYGAMGIVVSAIHVLLDEPVALKLLSPKVWGGSTAARFLREARAAARIRSEHVARVMDVGALQGGTPFIVMEHLDGLDLAATIRVRRTFAINEVVGYALQLCDALAEAHALGIVHRDLKPSNLFLAKRRDGSTLLKILDFGVSKVSTAAELTSAHAVVGSPHYMSPEQILSSRDVDGRADIWSMGVILYELLAGARPFDGRSRDELFHAISTSRPRPLDEMIPDVPPGLARLIDGCLEADLEKRISNVGELATRIAPFGDPGTNLIVERVVRLVASRPALPPVEMPPETPLRGLTRDESEDADDERSWFTSSSGDQTFVSSTLGGRFRLRRILGQGGMGVVYEAEDQTGDRVAVKVIRPEAARDPVARERLLREAESVKRVDSPHVVKIHEVAVDDATGAPFIVMDFLDGEDLAALLSRVGPLSPTAVARLFRQVCRGLAEAHAKGLVHRDIKPANLFLHRQGSSKILAKVCDFGIAKKLSQGEPGVENLTQTDTALGSPKYMSPEQAKNAKLADTRIDIWATCMSMYEALAGHYPWPHRTSPGELLIAICTEDIPPLYKAAPWVPRKLADEVHRGLKRDPANRIASAEELAKALKEHAGGSDELDEVMLSGILPEHRTVTLGKGKGVTAATGAMIAILVAASLLGGVPVMRGNVAPLSSSVVAESGPPVSPGPTMEASAAPLSTAAVVRTLEPSPQPRSSASAARVAPSVAPNHYANPTGTRGAKGARDLPQTPDAGDWTID